MGRKMKGPSGLRQISQMVQVPQICGFENSEFDEFLEPTPPILEIWYSVWQSVGKRGPSIFPKHVFVLPEQWKVHSPSLSR